MGVKRQKPKPDRDDMRRFCPKCGKPMPFFAEDEQSVTLSCHGWNYQDFGHKSRLWRTLHNHGVALRHEWQLSKSEETSPLPVAQRG